MSALRRMQGAVKAIQRDMAMDDATWRLFLNEAVKKRSSTQLNFDECKTVFAHAKSKGWVSPRMKVEKQFKAANFLWLQLKDAGKLNNGTRIAFIEFCKKHTKGKDPQKASIEQMSNVVEALKSWCDREGVSTGKIGAK